MKFSKPLVSVVVVAYDDEKLLSKSLPRTLEIMHKTGYPFEIIGVDNGSRDQSIEILSRFCDSVIRIQQNRFYVPALNKAYDACNGEIILVTCPDILWRDDSALLVQYSIGHRNCLFAPLYLNLDGSQQHILHNRRLGLSQVFFQMTPFGGFVDKHIGRFGVYRANHYAAWSNARPFLIDWTGGMFAVPSTVLHSLRGSDESMPLCYHDADFCDRLRSAGVKIVVLPNVRVLHTWAGTTSRDSRTADQAAKDFRAYISKHWQLKRVLAWPLILLAMTLSVPLVIAIQKKLPNRRILTLQVG